MDLTQPIQTKWTTGVTFPWKSSGLDVREADAADAVTTVTSSLVGDMVMTFTSSTAEQSNRNLSLYY